MSGLPTTTPKRVLLAAPRGYCAGVDRAVVTVEKALELYGAPVYVRKEIVHNKHVVTTLRKRGAIFVDETDEVPEGATVIFSAHGVAPGRPRRGAGPQPQDHRRDLPAGDQGAPRGRAVRRRRLRHPAHRPRGARGGRRHGGRGSGAHHARRRPRRRRQRRGARPREGRLAVPDHAVGRRDDGDGPAAAGAVPEAAGPAERRHLLRHPEPAGRRQADGAGVRPRARRRLAQLVELGPPRRGRPGPWCPGRAPRGLRRRDRRGVARGGVDRRASPRARACRRSWSATS